MKTMVLAVLLLGLLLSGGGARLHAQTPEAYPYIPYGNGVPSGVVPYGTNSYAYAPYDPYYELHAMHYQLYLQQYPPYQPCCFAAPGWGAPVFVLPPRIIIAPHPRPFPLRRR